MFFRNFFVFSFLLSFSSFSYSFLPYAIPAVGSALGTAMSNLVKNRSGVGTTSFFLAGAALSGSGSVIDYFTPRTEYTNPSYAPFITHVLASGTATNRFSHVISYEFTMLNYSCSIVATYIGQFDGQVTSTGSTGIYLVTSGIYAGTRGVTVYTPGYTSMTYYDSQNTSSVPCPKPDDLIPYVEVQISPEYPPENTLNPIPLSDVYTALNQYGDNLGAAIADFGITASDFASGVWDGAKSAFGPIVSAMTFDEVTDHLNNIALANDPAHVYSDSILFNADAIPEFVPVPEPIPASEINVPTSELFPSPYSPDDSLIPPVLPVPDYSVPPSGQVVVDNYGDDGLYINSVVTGYSSPDPMGVETPISQSVYVDPLLVGSSGVGSVVSTNTTSLPDAFVLPNSSSPSSSSSLDSSLLGAILGAVTGVSNNISVSNSYLSAINANVVGSNVALGNVTSQLSEANLLARQDIAYSRERNDLLRDLNSGFDSPPSFSIPELSEPLSESVPEISVSDFVDSVDFSVGSPDCSPLSFTVFNKVMVVDMIRFCDVMGIFGSIALAFSYLFSFVIVARGISS